MFSYAGKNLYLLCLAYYQTVLTLVVASACLFYVLRQPISASSKPPLPAPAPAVSPAKPVRDIVSRRYVQGF